MQEGERRATSEYGISLSTLMDRAGAGLAQVGLEMIATSPGAVWIFAGTGNNGGDGYVCARELMKKDIDVTVCSLGSPHPAGMAHEAAASYRTAGGVIVAAEDLASVPDNAALFIDCLLGTGLTRPVTGLYASLIEMINTTAVPVLACDVPSGVNADDGAVMGVAVRASVTLMMGLAKPACAIPPGSKYFGETEICDIGLPPDLVATLTPLDHIPGGATGH